MKKVLSVLLVVTLAFGLVACGKSDGKKEKEDREISSKELLSVYDFKIEDCVTLGDYGSIKVDIKDDYKVSDEDVKSYLASMLEGNDSYQKNDKQEVGEGDVANIDYVGYIDGKEFEGGSDKGMHLEIGSNSFIEGFESGLVGHKVGEKVTLNLKFPDDYWNEEYKGKDVKFDVTINHLEDKDAVSYDDATDEYVKNNFGYESKQEWYDATKETLENSKQQQKYNDIQSSFLKQLAEQTKVEVPESLVKDEVDITINQLTEYAKEQMDMELEEYVKEYEGVESLEEYKKKTKEFVTETLKEKLAIDAIIHAQKSTITTSGYDNFIAHYLESYGMDEETFYEKYGDKKKMMLVYAENLVLDQLVNKLNK